MKLLSLFLSILIHTCMFAGNIQIGGIEFAYRAPSKINANSRIMVLFGGRNWDGEKTLKTFNFEDFADKYNLVLVSPSFKNNEYWQPEKWSGIVLKEAIAKLESMFNLKRRKLFFYGYSAGGQCVNLFYNYMPESVEAWALHACGVYPPIAVENGVPALITCGLNDSERIRISRAFIYKYRERGGQVIWKQYKGGHELNKEALEIAKAFFKSCIENKRANFVGEDDSMRIVPISSVDDIDTEFRNYLYSEEIKKLWEEI